MPGRVRVYSAISLDGYLAGEGDDLSWMGEPDPDATLAEGVLDFEGFMSQVVLTLVPALLGRGVPLFTGEQRQHLRIVHQGRYGRMLQVVLSPG